MFSQQKLGAYLLKSTIGKLLQNVDWNQVQVQLIEGTITLHDCSLDDALFNRALETKGLLLVKGSIGSIKVRVPWSTFLQDSFSMYIENVELQVKIIEPKETNDHQSVLSSSFHFADDFIRSEKNIDDLIFDENEPSKGLTDLAQIIENIIGKVSVELKDVSIKILDANESIDTHLEMVIKHVALCDHINSRDLIPDRLKDFKDDILSHIVKFIQLKQASLVFVRNDSHLVLFEATETFIRLFFSQKGVIDQSIDISVPESVVFTDFNISTSTKQLHMFGRIADLEQVANFVNSQYKDILPKSEAGNSDSLWFEVLVEEMSMFVFPIQTDISAMNHLKCTYSDHFCIEGKDVLFRNSLLPNEGPTLKISTKDIKVMDYIYSDRDYHCLFTKWNDFNVLDKSKLFKQMVDTVNQGFELGLETLKSIGSNNPPTLHLNISTPPLILFGKYQQSLRWKSYLQVKEGKSVPYKLKPKKMMGFLFTFNIPLARCMYGMDYNNEKSPIIPLLDILYLVATYDTMTSRRSPKIHIEFGSACFGLANTSNATDFEHLFAVHDVSLQVTDNRNAFPNSGLTEDLLKVKHKHSRDNNQMDDASSKSWSDMGNGSDSQCSTNENIDILQLIPKDKTPVLSKFVVNLDIQSIVFTLPEVQFENISWIIKTIQKWTLKDPPDSSQPSLSMVVGIRSRNLGLTIVQGETKSTFCNDPWDYNFSVNEIDIVASINSQDAKNLTCAELWIASCELHTVVESNSWRLFTMSDSNRSNSSMIHVILTQNDDIQTLSRLGTITVLVSDALVYLPPSSIYLPLFPRVEGSESSNSMHSSLDLVVVLTNFSVGYSQIDTTAVLFQEYTKIETSIIQDSPTYGVEAVSTLSVLYVTKDDSISKMMLSDDEMSIKDLGMIPIATLDTFNMNFRQNGSGVLPSFDCDIYFRQLNIDTCTDTIQVIIKFLEKMGQTEATPEDQTNISPGSIEPENDLDIFEMIDGDAFLQDPFMEKAEDDSDFEWQFNFEDILNKEEILIDKINQHSGLSEFSLDTSYINNLEPLKDIFDIETPDVRWNFHDCNIIWKLYPGSDFQTESRTSTPVPNSPNFQSEKTMHPYVEIHLMNISLDLKLFPDNTLTCKSIVLNIKDIEILDRVPLSQWRKFLGYRSPDQFEPPRETDSDMLRFKWIGIRASQNEEYRLNLSILPLQFHIDQDTLLFLEAFFIFQPESPTKHQNNSNSSIEKEMRPTFFQLCEVHPITIQVDYKPKHVDYQKIQRGKFLQLLNFLHLDGAKIYLKPVTLTGIQGWAKLLKRIESVWLPHIKQTQIQNLASGLQGISSLINFGSGISDLVLLPIEQFQKDGRIFRGISRGTSSFLRATTLESAKIGSKIVTGAQNILEAAEKNPNRRISKMADTPKDLKQGLEMGFQSINQGIKSAAHLFQTKQFTPQTVPVAMIQPLKGVTSAIAHTLIGLQNTLDKTQQKRYHEKYKGY